MKRIIIVLLMLFSLVIGTTSSNADYIFNVNVGDKVNGISYNTLTNAGAFELFDVNTDYQWTSFCLEITQTLPQVAYIGGISNYATPGGLSGATGTAGDPIDDFTAWLYMNSELNNLYNYSGTNEDSHDLQKLIWFTEGELATESTYYDPTTVAEWKTLFATSGWTNDGIVQVLNMYKDEQRLIQAQDQLILAAVPEPSTLLLFGLGLLAFSKSALKTNYYLKKRRLKK